MRHIVEKLVGNLEDKRRWRDHKARVKALPPNYRTAAEAIERYLLRVGAFSDGRVMVDMLEDLDALFEQAVADATPVRTIVGEDPADFAETFLASYSGKNWIDKEREMLSEAIDQAQSDNEGGTGHDAAGSAEDES
ncbi:DUF1048 domain-containing protein [Acidipropionibacterium acidipropionici]|nr:DUF1048 domain-containing protein [Acidipropionibacterium acidipropionici]AZP39257.1 DUF1048 domain-containing protein [Acidipropionibacterium acidipropionici]QCV96965.1 DUF1048 domain-containing protein [Acidipropionibacterium acidipropionici]